MKFSIDKHEKYALMHLEEEKLDSTVSPTLKSEFVNLHSDGIRNIILDLSRVKYADSSGLSAILIANRLCQDAEGMFVMASLTDHVMKLIKISQLDTVLNLLPTVEEAVDAVYMNEIENELRSEGDI
jgi:anti-sigma B factor antagonist